MSLNRRIMRAPGNIRVSPAFIARVEALVSGNTPDQSVALVEAIEHMERNFNRKMEKVMHTLQEVLDLVTSQRTQIDGVTALVVGLRNQVKVILDNNSAAQTTQQLIDQVFEKAAANASALTDAIKENTPEATAGAVTGGPGMSDIKQGLGSNGPVSVDPTPAVGDLPTGDPAQPLV